MELTIEKIPPGGCWFSEGCYEVRQQPKNGTLAICHTEEDALLILGLQERIKELEAEDERKSKWLSNLHNRLCEIEPLVGAALMNSTKPP